ncbi:cytochrome P450 [Pseudactinotalea sp. HY158]|uniref:cytochrome P450 n=1 Tax=Pseudactinotalea sp. HY158 TaxID=2654547 RepID=UPI001E335D32|nr:cytochrome P450 [Pseudactinotalea sp. HY158]
MDDDVRLSRKRDEPDEPRVDGDRSVWRIRSLAAARQVLRARSVTTQAGFTAEAIPKGYFRHHPILVSDGPQHDEQRRKVARFFAPAVVHERYGADIRTTAEDLIDAAVAAGTCTLDEIALRFTVDVTRRIVGIDHSSLRGLCRRLDSFFNQPPLDVTRADFGRSRAQWARAGINALVPLLRFYLADVRPAVRRRRRHPGATVVDHLIAEGYRTPDILVECLTYGTAGMVTTREFITMACWHLLRDDALRERYLVAGEAERTAILEEILRLEPVVGHLYRRMQQDFELTHGESTFTLRAGDLVDVCVRQTNTDAEAVGAHPRCLRPGRELPRGVAAAGLSFSDGAHKCPGQTLAMAETDIFLTRLLRANPRPAAEPTLTRDQLIEGYALRGMVLSFG